MLVALLQIWSYPMHDPVMMDRGFLADRETTRKRFLHAAWISIICIIAFGCLGVLAGAHATQGTSMNETLMQLLGTLPMLLFNAALVISAMLTLDSTLSSSAKLLAVDMRVMKMNLRNGRAVMAAFMLVGLLLKSPLVRRHKTVAAASMQERPAPCCLSTGIVLPMNESLRKIAYG